MTEGEGNSVTQTPEDPRHNKRFKHSHQSTSLHNSESNYSWCMDNKMPTFSPSKFSMVEKKQSAGFYTVMTCLLNRHQAEIDEMLKDQMKEIEKGINMFSLRLEEFQTVFDWKQNM